MLSDINQRNFKKKRKLTRKNEKEIRSGLAWAILIARVFDGKTDQSGRITMCIWAGPWTPMTRFISMSAVLLGPEMIVIPFGVLEP